uniref:Ribosomal protein L20 n=1 Tax=Palmaria palmata TaxID=2822 RepID=A0A0A7A6M2_PALPL|nr:ribosomal protein L20 [Palmaria palmata]AHB62171.1 ribosomal protein L20 [Palmaria palmata]
MRLSNVKFEVKKTSARKLKKRVFSKATVLKTLGIGPGLLVFLKKQQRISLNKHCISNLITEELGTFIVLRFD